MKVPVVIRRARIKDIPEIMRMWKHFMKEHDDKVTARNPALKSYYEFLPNASSLFEKYARSCIMSKNAVIFVAENEDENSDSEILGYCLCIIKKNIPIFKVERLGHIGDLYVKRDHRGKGISSMFRDEAVKWLKKKKIKYSSIMVSPENKEAHRIYRSWGFEDFHLELRRKI